MLKDYAAACRALWHALSIPNNIYTFGPKATRRSEDCCRDHTFYFDSVKSPRSYTIFSWSNLNLVRTNWGRFQCITVCWITVEEDSRWKESRLQIYLICAAPLPRSVSLLAFQTKGMTPGDVKGIFGPQVCNAFLLNNIARVVPWYFHSTLINIILFYLKPPSGSNKL